VSPPTSREVASLLRNRTALCAHTISRNFVVR
jgi:hypothetical protein